MGENMVRLIRPADIITLFNAILGFASVIMAVEGESEIALVLILAAVIGDAADGAVARYTGTGVLGANLDSLADVIAFGVAPATAAFVFLKDGGAVSWIFPGFFLACGTLRLARFNAAEKKDGFEGVPITSGGFIVALFLLVKDYFLYSGHMFILLLVIVSLLMVSTISYPKLRSPYLLAPMGFLLILDIAGFNRSGISLILFIFAVAYILSPIGKRFYDRNK